MARQDQLVEAIWEVVARLDRLMAGPPRAPRDTPPVTGYRSGRWFLRDGTGYGQSPYPTGENVAYDQAGDIRPINQRRN